MNVIVNVYVYATIPQSLVFMVLILILLALNLSFKWRHLIFLLDLRQKPGRLVWLEQLLCEVLPFFNLESTTIIYDLAVYLKDGLYFGWDTSLGNSSLQVMFLTSFTFVFLLLVLVSLSVASLLFNLAFWYCFLKHRKVLLIKPPANVSVLVDFNTIIRTVQSSLVELIEMVDSAVSNDFMQVAFLGICLAFNPKLFFAVFLHLLWNYNCVCYLSFHWLFLLVNKERSFSLYSLWLFSY